jgi:hypothetical protein
MHTRTFGPTKLSVMRGAFDDAMCALGDDTSEANRETLRDAVGKAVVDLAMAGRSERAQLANYAVYQGRMLVDLKRV